MGSVFVIALGSMNFLLYCICNCITCCKTDCYLSQRYWSIELIRLLIDFNFLTHKINSTINHLESYEVVILLNSTAWD